MTNNIASNIINGIGIFLTSVMSWLWGPLDGLIAGILFFAAVDVITGMVGAMINGTYNSSKFTLKKKIGIAIAIAVLYRVDMIVPTLSKYIPALADWAAPLRDICIATFIVNDITSIFENLSEWGVPIPKVITDRLAQLKEKER